MMTCRGTFTTSLVWEDGEDEIEASVAVLYCFSRGYPETMEGPGCDPEIEIISITPKDQTITIPERFDTDDDLIAECFADARDQEEEAAEWRAQFRRDWLMEERP